MWECKSRTSEEYGLKPFKTSMKKECVICGFKDFLQIHHIIPLSKDGDHCEENVVMLCLNHHKMIHSKIKDRLKLPKVGKKRTFTTKELEFEKEKNNALLRGARLSLELFYWPKLTNTTLDASEFKEKFEELNKINQEYGFDGYNGHI